MNRIYGHSTIALTVILLTSAAVFHPGGKAQRIAAGAGALGITPGTRGSGNPLGMQGAEDPTCSICELVDSVDTLFIADVIRALSGRDSIEVSGIKTKLSTRYAYSSQKDTAAAYLLDLIGGLGYSPVVQEFILTVTRPELMGITVSAGGDTVWCGSIEGRIYMSTSSWDWDRFEELESIDARVNRLETGPDGRIWAVCKAMGSGLGRLLVSADGGSVWEVIVEGAIKNVYALKTLSFWDGQYGFVAGDFGSFLNTSDGGGSWWGAGGPEQFSYRSINGSAATGPMHFWVVTEGGFLYESANFGYSWTGRQLSSRNLKDIDFNDPDNGVIVGDKVVFYTSDAGVNWTEVPVLPILNCVEMESSSRVIASGSGGDVWVSGDGGASWDPTGTQCTGTTDVWSFDVAGSGRVWAAGRDKVARVDFSDPLPECRIYALADTIWGKNIIFRREGRSSPEKRIVVCGHYDSFSNSGDPIYSAPGADDNASGTACVLECARLLSDAKLDKSIEFILFDGEEVLLKGSQYFVANIDTEAVYEGAFNIDMVGNSYDGSGSIYIGGVEETGDTLLIDLLCDVSEDFGLQYPLSWFYAQSNNQPPSDQIPFRTPGRIPSVLVIESGYRLNPHYHKSTDLIDFIELPYVRDAAKAVLAASALLAGYHGSENDSIPPYVLFRPGYPNPFYSNTRLEFGLPHEMPVEMAVYDVQGRRVALLIRDTLGPGWVYHIWDGTNDSGRKVASGVYFIRFRAGSTTVVRKAVLLR